MGKRIEFRLSGSGGQGVISAGIILADAAVHDGQYAIQSQSYGPEARGGSSKAEVVISAEPIDYPKATNPNYVLCLTDESYHLYGENANPDSVVFVDSLVDTTDCKRDVIKVPIVETARQLNPQGANIIAVGFLVGYTGVVTREATVEAIVDQFPKFIEKNMKCVEAGFKFADDLKK